MKADAEELQFLEWSLEVGSKNKSIPMTAHVKMPFLQKLTLKKKERAKSAPMFYSTAESTETDTLMGAEPILSL